MNVRVSLEGCDIDFELKESKAGWASTTRDTGKHSRTVHSSFQKICRFRRNYSQNPIDSCKYNDSLSSGIGKSNKGCISKSYKVRKCIFNCIHPKEMVKVNFTYVDACLVESGGVVAIRSIRWTRFDWNDIIR